jgi:hypothetical protein
MKYSREEWDEKLQEIIKMMEEDYPNGYELVINSFSAEIRSNLTTMCFTKSGPIHIPEGTKKSFDELFNKLKEQTEPPKICYQQRCEGCKDLVKEYIPDTNKVSCFVCKFFKKKIYSNNIIYCNLKLSTELDSIKFMNYGETYEE